MASQKTVLITGCSDGGIGSALATTFQQRGFHVFATARDPSKMQDLKGLPNVSFLTLDVVNQDDIKAAVEAVSKHTSNGSLDCLISNAGRNHFMPMLDESLDAIRGIFEINFIGPIALAQAFAPMLIKARGTAVFITSTSGHLNIPYMGTYAASKMSTEIVAETLRLELAPFGVNVLEVVTGAVKSMGQTYFGDFKLPQQSVDLTLHYPVGGLRCARVGSIHWIGVLMSCRLYKSIEPTIAGRAQGNDGLPRMDTLEYAKAVVHEIMERTPGRVWYGGFADNVKMSTTAANVPQSALLDISGSFYGPAVVTLSWVSNSISQPAPKFAAAIALVNAICNTPNIWGSILNAGLDRGEDTEKHGPTEA
ncbi:hypothetical protein CHU98_g11850 [Xylaria longipes]|nr:hypothetical protein CHU98_g11850 [Xylaria longipes]